MSRRHNGEGSIYPVKNGYRGYVWCINPAGNRYRKYVKAQDLRGHSGCLAQAPGPGKQRACRLRRADPGEILVLLA